MSWLVGHKRKELSPLQVELHKSQFNMKEKLYVNFVKLYFLKRAESVALLQFSGIWVVLLYIEANLTRLGFDIV